MEREPEISISEDRFAEIQDRFQALSAALTDDQLLRLADTYHEVLRLRRVRRASQARLTEAASFAAP